VIIKTSAEGREEEEEEEFFNHYKNDLKRHAHTQDSLIRRDPANT